MSKHIPVLANEAIGLLDIKPNGIYVDGTLGRGGHSEMILERLKEGKLYCFDLDEEAINESKEKLQNYLNVVYIHDNFMNMNKYLEEVDGILLDLGVSSPQFDEASRGFSYRYDDKLDMRMNRKGKLSAYDVVNEYSGEELERIFKDYGQERFSKNIAREIVEKRKEKKIETTFELVDIIKDAYPKKALSQKGHPAKQVFQALRIEVNGELESLNVFLESFDKILKIDGNLAIISFHSLEDALVKKKFKEISSTKDDKRIPKRPEEIKEANYQLLTRKAIVASKEEIEKNRRAKSAKLRGVKKLWQES